MEARQVKEMDKIEEELAGLRGQRGGLRGDVSFCDFLLRGAGLEGGGGEGKGIREERLIKEWQMAWLESRIMRARGEGEGRG